MNNFDDDSAVEAVASRVRPVWEQVIDDMAATADEYRDDGWDAIECHPGDVAAIGTAEVEREGARTGLDIVVPDDEFERVETAVDGPGAFDEVEVYRGVENRVVFVTVALENEVAETVVLVPAYYDLDQSDAFVEMVRQEACLRLYLRPIDQRRVITFSNSEPALFLPTEV